MYVAMLLTDWLVSSNAVNTTSLMYLNRNVVMSQPTSEDYDVYIGRSEVAMWMRVVSSWMCMLLYIWSLVAPVVMPDRLASSSFLFLNHY